MFYFALVSSQECDVLPLCFKNNSPEMSKFIEKYKVLQLTMDMHNFEAKKEDTCAAGEFLHFHLFLSLVFMAELRNFFSSWCNVTASLNSQLL